MKLLLLLVGFFALAPTVCAQSPSLRGGGYDKSRKQKTPSHRQLSLFGAPDAFIFQNAGDGSAIGQGDQVGADCSTDTRRVTFVDGDGSGDYMDVTTTKWHSGGYRLDCRDKGSHTGWQCWATCAGLVNPDFLEWTHLTFEAQVINAATLPEGCEPAMSIKKRWPGHRSNTITLRGSNYVDGGRLVDSEFRRVVIPMADLATDQWPDLSGVKDVYFRSCGANTNPHYQIKSLLLTSNPPALGAAADTESPTEAPTESPTSPHWPIFSSAEDEHSVGPGTPTTCFLQKERLGITTTEDAEGDYFTVTPDPWMSGGLRFGCMEKDDSYNCISSCYSADGSEPDWSNKLYLTFKAKVEGGTCKPQMSLQGGGWPRHSSYTIALEGAYVDAGSLVSHEWRRVVVPLADFKTPTWSLTRVWGMSFHTCGTGGHTQPTYHISDLATTDLEFELEGAPDTPSPTDAPTHPPTTSRPTSSPTPSPTAAPTEPLWPIFSFAEDEFSAGTGESVTCFLQKERLGMTTTSDDVEGDYFTVTPDPWVSGGLRFGCMEKDDSYNCISSCYSADGSEPDWLDRLYLTFKAKVEGSFSTICKPRMSLEGGGWPRKPSQTITLEGTYVDAGSLVSDEWRRVVVPLDDFKTDAWSLTEVWGMSFQTCGTSASGHSGPQPTYHISQLATTNLEFDLLSQPPSQSPTEYVTIDPLMATHRWVYKNWYPIFGSDREPEGNVWMVVENDAWPFVTGSPPAQSVTIFIPQDQTVVYSGNDSIQYEKIIVEGKLTIEPMGADVSLTVGTIVVEKGGILDVQTNNSSHKIEINIEGALDLTLDPEEQLLGIVSLEGNLTITGDPISTKMVSLGETAVAGSTSLLASGTDFEIGGELILPDTQIGLNTGHWNFASSGYVDQTESCTIASIDGAVITCQSPLTYSHSIGSYLGYITRSITIRTSSNSQDQGHILHTGTGKFDVRNTRVERLGRTTIEVIDSTVMAPVEDANFPRGLNHAQMVVSKLGSNQIARYALHAHHSLVESHFSGNALLYSPRDGCVAHNSRVHILDNVIVGAEGTGVFLEDATETGPVINNYIIGTGGGTRGGDDGRFSTSKGLDMAHGGFGIWARGKLALIKDNHCEGHFGVAPYAFFVHPNFISDKQVPNVRGTPAELVGKSLSAISQDIENGLQLQTYGGFVNNSATGSFQVGLELSYFSSTQEDEVGSIIEELTVVSLASSGRGISTTHSRVFALNNVTIKGAEGNSITGIWCNNCNGCALDTPNTTLVVENISVVRGGNC